MNRIIKFRAWDEKNKKMIALGHPHYHDAVGGILMYAIEPMVKYDNWDKKSPHLMQYTGLKDKNGKEIFEGDILKTEHGATGIMTWHDVSAQFNYDCKEPMWSHPIYSMSGDNEIIGNIYENPELLTPNK